MDNHPSALDSTAMECSFVYYEFRFHVDFPDECARVWIGRIERFHLENVIQCNRYGGGSVMIRG
jgi:hypothetical protein